MTASNDRREHTFRWRLLQFLFAAFLLAPGLVLQAPPATVRADPLSDAIAEQQRLAKLIAQQQTQLKQLTAQQATLKSQIATTQQNLTGVRTSIDEAQSQVTALQGEVVVAKARYDGLSAQQALLATRLAQLTNEQNAKERELKVRQQILASRLIAAYETDQTPLLQQAITAHSLTEALADVSYDDALSAADRDLADEIKHEQAVLAEVRTSVEMATSANGQLVGQVAAQRQQLQDEQVQLADTQDQLAALKTQLEAQLAQQKAAETKLEQNQTALNAAIQSNGAALDQLGQRSTNS